MSDFFTFHNNVSLGSLFRVLEKTFVFHLEESPSSSAFTLSAKIHSSRWYIDFRERVLFFTFWGFNGNFQLLPTIFCAH